MHVFVRRRNITYCNLFYKAYVGFHSYLDGKLSPIATGNWGCGAFKGDPKLKFIIQLMACNAARRNMVYYTFDNAELRDTIHDLYLFLGNNKVTTRKSSPIFPYFLNYNSIVVFSGTVEVIV